MGNGSSKKKNSEEANEEQSPESVNEDQSPESASSPTEENSGKDNEEEQKNASTPQQLLQAGVICYLILNKANCYARDSYGSTPLHVAAMRNNDHAVEEFLKVTGERKFQSLIQEILKKLDPKEKEEQARTADSEGPDNPDSSNVGVVEKSGDGSHEVKNLGEKEKEEQARTADLAVGSDKPDSSNVGVVEKSGDGSHETSQQGKDERKNTKELEKQNVKPGKSMKTNEEFTTIEKSGSDKVTSNSQDASDITVLEKDTVAAKSGPAANKGNIWSKIFSRDVATEVLNKCIEENKKDRTDIGYSITFDFSFIDDTFCDFMKSTDLPGTKSGNAKKEDKQRQTENTTEEKPYTSNALILKTNHPLTIMVKYEQSSLIGHPIVKSLIRHKWNTYSRQVYYSGMMIYLLFVLLLTGYLSVNTPTILFP
ncbi:myb-like protein X [Ptychodera flava]|uniref:myb-like protein X n=1 Tax=Ptychodera flava TaxID=63121 RepID=UPI003969EAD6